MSGQSGGHRLRLSKLNDQLTCKLCGGYFIDATTIIECLHSFCRSCIVKYLENNKYCPICEVQVHKSRPLLNIRPDHTLQDIVYKLVPGCYQNEMRCRREFYSKHPEASEQAASPEARGEPTESHIYSPDESLSLSLEYFSPCTKEVKEPSTKHLLRRYLRCPAAVTVFHLQKLIRAKYGLTDAHRVDVMYKEEPLCSSYTLMDVMYIYHWRRKVPLHLSYRIFESSPKRIKLSEDNANYKSSLLHAGIDTIEAREEKSLKREWKEVQLKISETGVMSITDISDQRFNRGARIEDAIAKLENITASTENSERGESVEKNERPLINSTKDCRDGRENEVENVIPSLNSNDGGKDSMNELNPEMNATTEETKVITRSKQEERGAKDYPNNNNVDVKTLLQKNVQPRETTAEECKPNPVVCNNVEKLEQKQSPRNNNNNTILAESKLEIRKQNAKNDVKVGNAGSKIDALSVKLQFQPKVGQIGNTYSKKISKEKKLTPQAVRKVDAKAEGTRLPETKNSSDLKPRVNCGTVPSKFPVTRTNQQKPEAGVANVSHTSEGSALPETPPSTCTSSVGDESGNKTEKEAQESEGRHSVEEQKNIEQKPSSCEENVADSVHTVSAEPVTTAGQKSPQNETPISESLITSSIPTPTPAISQPSFPYTVQDLVNSTILKSSLKSLTSTAQKVSPASQETTMTTCTMPESVAYCMQSSMNATTSLKNSYPGQGINTARQVSSKVNFEVTGVYSVPPCPDAIPISLMKPTIRKSELIAKGSNLNEICAKIGASGSKINDICAKIGENSKEKNKSEARSKSDIPDLLKIGRKSSSPATAVDSTNKQQHTNIPNIPVYAPNSSSITTENKNVYSTVKDSLRATSLISVSPIVTPHTLQKVSSPSISKKQSQAVGYKTLRDPPRCWNPTLSRNNYVAVKNQSKEMQNQPQQASISERSKPIQSKPAKIFKMRNIPRYLGNPASGVKPMYAIGNENKEKEQSTTTTTTASSKNVSLSMMKIDPKTLSPIVSTVNSPIVSPPPYSPSARNYQNLPFSRDICRSTGSPISPKNSPVNMLSTNPFIPSPTPNTNPRLIYSHFPSPFPDASRFPNPLIRSPIGIPPPSAFHSSLPPSINKLYQRSSYIPQTTGFSPVSQPPTVQRIPPSTYSSPKSPKTTSLTAISPSSFSLTKPETQMTTATSHDSSSLLLPENSPRDDLSAFNLSKTGGFSKIDTPIDAIHCSKPNSPPSSNFGQSRSVVTTAMMSKAKIENPSVNVSERKESKESKDAKKLKEQKETKESKEKESKELETKEAKEAKESNEGRDLAENETRANEDSPNSFALKGKNVDKRRGGENTEAKEKIDKRDHSQGNGEFTEYFGNPAKENKEEELTEKDLERPKDQVNVKNVQEIKEKGGRQQEELKSEELGKNEVQLAAKKSESQINKMET